MSLIRFSCLPLLPFYLPILSFCLHFLLVSLSPSHSCNLKSWQIFLYFQRVEEMGESWSQGLAASVVAGGRERQQPDGEWTADSSPCPFFPWVWDSECGVLDQGRLARTRAVWLHGNIPPGKKWKPVLEEGVSPFSPSWPSLSHPSAILLPVLLTAPPSPHIVLLWRYFFCLELPSPFVFQTLPSRDWPIPPVYP